MGAGAGSHNAKLATVARARGLRIVGPNCLGVIAPHANLFASFAAHRPLPGDLALLSQSGAVAAGVLEWARPRDIGFSAVRSEEHTSELQSLMRNAYAVVCLEKNK